MTKILGRNDLLGNHLKRELVEVPELDGSLYLRELSTSQILAFNARVEKLRSEGHQEVTPEVSVSLMALLLSFSACDEDGNLLFTEADAGKLVDNNISTLTSLSTKVMEISGLNEVAANLPNALTTSSSSD